MDIRFVCTIFCCELNIVLTYKGEMKKNHEILSFSEKWGKNIQAATYYGECTVGILNFLLQVEK